MNPIPMLSRPLLVAGLALASMAATAYGGDLPKVEFEKFELPNGLRVILSVDKSAPVVATFVHYHVGSKNERPDRTGFAHFFEHLMFEGTDNIPRHSIDLILQNAGARHNAFTTTDETGYWLNLPANQLKLALWIESERMLHAKVETVGVETQRSVVKEEKKVRLDNRPYSSFNQYLAANLAAGTPYEWIPIGSAQYIDKATIDEFRDFYHTYYVPNNAVLAIVGDIDIAQTKKLVMDYFGDIPRGKDVVRPEVNFPLGTQEKVLEVKEDKTPLPGLVYGYRTVGHGNPDAYALDILSRILAIGNSSRMYRDMVDEKQIAVEADAFLREYEKAGFFNLLAIAHPNVTMDQLATEFDKQIDEVQKSGVTEREFQKARNQVKTEYAGRFNDALQKAQSMATYETFYNDPGVINTEIDRYMAVTREDIQRVAKKYLVPTNRVVLKYLPPAKGGSN
jgi:predicted Zn-dependent peptidase